MKYVFVIEEADNVGTAVGEPVKKGDEVGTQGRVTGVAVTANDDIAYGHKIALRDIAKGEQVIKYALSIGTASKAIKAGDHVHVHNVESNRGRGDLAAKEKEAAR
jgi:altronate dehydratase small subunit